MPHQDNTPVSALASPTPIHPSNMSTILAALSRSVFFKTASLPRDPRAPNVILLSSTPSSPSRCRALGKLHRHPAKVEVRTPGDFSIGHCLVSAGCAAGGVGVGFVDVNRPVGVKDAMTDGKNLRKPQFRVTLPSDDPSGGSDVWFGPGRVCVFVKKQVSQRRGHKSSDGEKLRKIVSDNADL